MGKSKLKKSIESYEKQIRIHKDKLNEAKERGDEGSIKYLSDEIENLEKNLEEVKINFLPRSDRIKFKKREKIINLTTKI